MKKLKAKASSPAISVRNRQRSVGVDIASLERFARKALDYSLRHKKRGATELMRLHAISVLLVSDRRMAELHRRFLGKRGPTDVLSFEHGEIVVSVETAVRNARRFRSSLGKELRLYIVHGLLHLHGFDDRTPADAQKMEATQKRILSRAMV